MEKHWLLLFHNKHNRALNIDFSVLISVYRQEDPTFLEKAFESIWDTQELKPTEIVVVKDGPLTNSLNNVIDKWHRRIGDLFKIVGLKKNIGLGAALNVGLERCNNSLVARMDADDLSLPARFDNQVKFMKNNPEVAVSSSWIEEINEDNEVVSVRKLPQKHDEIFDFAKSRNPISHPVAMFRKEAVLSVGGYPEFRKSQDYALWSLMLQNGYKFANIPEVLLKMRTGEGLLKRRNLDYFFYEYEIFRFQKKIGFISNTGFLKNVISRVALRISPAFIKKLFYKYLR